MTTQIKQKLNKLEEIAAELKRELFGIDHIIDRVIKSISAWYIAPEIVSRPVIINLWGMTGVGKTDLVRKLVQKLEFQQSFVEIQMDGGSGKSSFNNSIQSTLSRSNIKEGQPGILLLDEMQRYRTVSNNDNEVKNDKYKDVWTLLSDGKFSIDASVFHELEMMLHCRAFSDDRKQAGLDDEDDDASKSSKAKFKLYPYEAQELKQLLKLPYGIEEIMTWPPERVISEIKNVSGTRKEWEADYTKLVIFISGNLDSAFAGSMSTNDCDTDADFFHEITKKISVTEIKYHLRTRFSPEQVARFGNNHIIYPSLNKATYERLIKKSIDEHVTKFEQVSKYKFVVCPSVNEQIYMNSVYPAQGTRPVFSSVHMIFTQLLVDITFYCLINDIDSTNPIEIAMHDFTNVMAKINGDNVEFPIYLELNQKRNRNNTQLKTMVSVHEAGHALAYTLLKKTAPHETKSNTTSYQGGYVLPSPKNSSFITRAGILNDIQITLAGKAAERVVFGIEHQTNGSGSDIANATALASEFIRSQGMGNTLAKVDSESEHTTWVCDMRDSDSQIECILRKEMEKVTELIHENAKMLMLISDKLIADETISKAEMTLIFNSQGYGDVYEDENHTDFNKMLKEFKVTL